jgi:hypothetical protein
MRVWRRRARRREDEGMSDESERAAQAYVYGFPLVFNLEQVQRFVTTGIGMTPPAPWNVLSHASTLAGPDDTFVTINNDTVYSIAQLDLGAGPLLLEVPDTGGRYYVLQFVSAWTENFAYVGHRATGTKAGRFLLVPRDWQGDAPEDATVIRVPTRIASIVGRWAVDGEDDLPAVRALQLATTLTPLDPSAVAEGLPEPAPAASEAMTFWQRYLTWSEAFPPAERDRPLQESFAPLGLTGAAPLDTEALIAGYEAGKAQVAAILSSGGTNPEVNGWKLTYHVFDYNLDYFEVGTIDDPQFEIADPRQRIGTRAAAAQGGLWGNHAYEAAYIMTYVDDRGEPLSGDRVYRMTLTEQPPVGAFWSITMYDVPDYFLVANPIDRYSVGDRTPGLVYGDDGSLEITISHDEPADATARANWLPAPAGAFRPVLRMYEPGPEVLDQAYVVPSITRVAGE